MRWVCCIMYVYDIVYKNGYNFRHLSFMPIITVLWGLETGLSYLNHNLPLRSIETNIFFAQKIIDLCLNDCMYFLTAFVY